MFIYAIWPHLFIYEFALQWKERNAAVGSIENILKAAGGRIQNTVNELLSALKVRLRYCRCLTC